MLLPITSCVGLNFNLFFNLLLSVVYDCLSQRVESLGEGLVSENVGDEVVKHRAELGCRVGAFVRDSLELHVIAASVNIRPDMSPQLVGALVSVLEIGRQLKRLFLGPSHCAFLLLQQLLASPDGMEWVLGVHGDDVEKTGLANLWLDIERFVLIWDVTFHRVDHLSLFVSVLLPFIHAIPMALTELLLELFLGPDITLVPSVLLDLLQSQSALRSVCQHSLQDALARFRDATALVLLPELDSIALGKWSIPLIPFIALLEWWVPGEEDE